MTSRHISRPAPRARSTHTQPVRPSHDAGQTLPCPPPHLPTTQYACLARPSQRSRPARPSRDREAGTPSTTPRHPEEPPHLTSVAAPHRGRALALSSVHSRPREARRDWPKRGGLGGVMIGGPEAASPTGASAGGLRAQPRAGRLDSQLTTGLPKGRSRPIMGRRHGSQSDAAVCVRRGRISDGSRCPPATGTLLAAGRWSSGGCGGLHPIHLRRVLHIHPS